MKKLYACLGVLACLSAYAGDKCAESKNKSDRPMFQQGDDSLGPTVTAGYSTPARVRVQNGYDVMGSVSYIYWLAAEGGLDIATTALFDNATARSSPATPKSSPVFQSQEFSSGFKLGVAYATPCDDWVLRADYTWLHQQTTSHASVSDTLAVIEPAFYFTNWFFQVLAQGQGPASSAFSSKWRLNLDWLDVSLQRAYYSGRSLTLTPFMGMRAAWIRQKLNIDVEEVLNAAPPTSVVSSHNRAQSWGLGPRFGTQARYLLGAGARLQGEIGASLLFTQFTKIAHSEETFSIGGSGVAYQMRNFNCLRPMVEANLGLGWGRYFNKQRWHFDVSATYDFNYLWAQNMMRVLNDMNVVGINAAANDLYLQGLTLTTAFDF